MKRETEAVKTARIHRNEQKLAIRHAVDITLAMVEAEALALAPHFDIEALQVAIRRVKADAKQGDISRAALQAVREERF